MSWTPLYDRSYFQETTSYLHKDFAVVEISKYIKCQQIIVPLIVDRKCEHFGNELKPESSVSGNEMACSKMLRRFLWW